MFQQMVRSLYFLLMIIAFSAHSLNSDKEKVMRVVADSADLNQQNHQGVYTGNVELVQGTSNLQAAKAITKGNAQNKLTLAIASGVNGKQAHYWTTTDPKKPPFHAYADTIRYYPLRHLIELTGNAHVEQGNDSLSAEKITYDTQKQHVVTQKGTVIIIHPKGKKKAL